MINSRLLAIHFANRRLLLINVLDCTSCNISKSYEKVNLRVRVNIIAIKSQYYMKQHRKHFLKCPELMKNQWQETNIFAQHAITIETVTSQTFETSDEFSLSFLRQRAFQAVTIPII